MQGMCLKCAYESELPGMDQILEKAGINDENIDEITARMNEVLAGISAKSPDELLKGLLSVDFSELSSMGGFPFGLDASSDESGDEEAPGEDDDSDKRDKRAAFRPYASLGELMPANVSGEMDAPADRRSKTSDGKRATVKKVRKRKFLEQFAINLTEGALEGRVDRIIGRDEELARTIQILNRRTKNNPALIGEAGVGKTAIAEGLAVRIAEGKVPAKLLDQELFLLDMTAMVAGTQFRGQFESRMKGVVDDARRSGNVILVIDELHNIMGAGDAEGAMNAANILKPALARGEIKVIGSTTLNEYRRFIEKDSALERRFQKVMVNEPSEEMTIQILLGIKDYYEKHHHVIFPPHVLETAARLSNRYIMDRYQPDKSIDLIDEAGSRQNLDSECLTVLKRLNDRKAEIEEMQQDNEKELSEHTSNEDNLPLYEAQASLRSEMMRVEAQIEEVEETCVPVEITDQDIAGVVEMWTGIPVQKLTQSETDRLLNLEERLHERVIGQDEAISALSRAVRRTRAGFKQKHKPASFLFVGPTGVGKTELVKSLAEVMFDTEDNLVRLDMSEFMEPHTVSKLIGSPPGYIGYDDGGQLTEKIRRKPYSVVLFDEIEKAHADVYNMLLQILDEGRLTDSHGRVVNFENTIIVMTSNAGTTLKSHGIGFGSSGHQAMEERVDTILKELFRPEFLNRIDEIIIFHELSRDQIREIVDLMLKEPQRDLARRGIELEVTASARDALAKEGYDPKFGARPLRRTIQRRIEDTLADLWLTREIASAKQVTVDVAPEGSEAREKGEYSMIDGSGCYSFRWDGGERIDCTPTDENI
jgi:ATP-dependent Clp protease ATP-binding subunit ClpE